MQLNKIIDTDMLANEIDAGYVTERFHPEFPELTILNYSDRCQFDGHWTDVTKRTRGLIYNQLTGEVVARGLPKFFNYGDTQNVGQLDPDMRILSAHDKADGSLGIGYLRPDGKAAIATRGSFVSEQALHAMEILDESIAAIVNTEWLYGRTPLWEIIYPENRIVLNYGDRDELIYLGSVDNATGEFQPHRTSEYDVAGGTLRDVLEREPRKNAEGYVIWLSATEAVKLKQDDYVALHRIVSNLTVKEVWRQLRDGTFQEFAESLPDEFHDWARDTSDGLWESFYDIQTGAEDWLVCLPIALTTRKEQALWIQGNVPAELRGLVFSLLDDKSLDASIWRMVEPKEKVLA